MILFGFWLKLVVPLGNPIVNFLLSTVIPPSRERIGGVLAKTISTHWEENMKRNPTVSIAAIALFAALAVPFQLRAQSTDYRPADSGGLGAFSGYLPLVIGGYEQGQILGESDTAPDGYLPLVISGDERGSGTMSDLAGGSQSVGSSGADTAGNCSYQGEACGGSSPCCFGLTCRGGVCVYLGYCAPAGSACGGRVHCCPGLLCEGVGAGGTCI